MVILLSQCLVEQCRRAIASGDQCFLKRERQGRRGRSAKACARVSETMLDLLETFRTRLAGRPLLLLVAVLALLLIGRRSSGHGASASVWMLWAPRVVGSAGLLGLLAYAAVAVWYACDPHFVDNAEPTIPALGWLFHVGQPIYPPPDSAERYAHIYGPMAYMFHGFALAAFWPGIEISKGVGVSAGIGSLALLYGAIRSHGSAMRAAALTGVCGLMLLLFRHYSFWTRPDPLQLLSVSAALLFAVSLRGYTSAVLVGIASGVLWNLKFTGPLYSLPLIALLHRRTGLRGAIVALTVGVAVAIMPFVYFPNVSLGNYLTWVQLSAGTGLLLSVLRQNLEWAVYLCVPLLLSYHAIPRELRSRGAEWRDVLVALLIGICGVVVAAAKPGAGPYHLIPFLPILLYVVSVQMSGCSFSLTIDATVPRASIVFVLLTVFIALAQQSQLVTTLVARAALHEAADIRRFADTHRGIVEMGYGQTEWLTFARPILVFRNNSYLLDQPAVREHQLAGVEVPRATIDALANCRVNYWLIPKGEPPFSGVNGYAAVLLRPLYSDEFRRVFTARHRHTTTTTYYDVWQCQTGSGT